MGNGTCYSTKDGKVLSCNNTPFTNYKCLPSNQINCPANDMFVQHIGTIYCNTATGCHSNAKKAISSCVPRTADKN
jgi:hypothetical protein